MIVYADLHSGYLLGIRTYAGMYMFDGLGAFVMTQLFTMHSWIDAFCNAEIAVSETGACFLYAPS